MKATQGGRRNAQRRRINDPQGTRRNIVEVATHEFAQKGFSGARVDAIGSVAQCPNSSRYLRPPKADPPKIETDQPSIIGFRSQRLLVCAGFVVLRHAGGIAGVLHGITRIMGPSSAAIASKW